MLHVAALAVLDMTLHITSGVRNKLNVQFMAESRSYLVTGTKAIVIKMLRPDAVICLQC